MEKLKNNHLLLVILACLAIFFSHLDVLIVNIMEARNFVTAREMLDDGHWIFTTLNGEARYQKPPLPTWLTALSASIFGLKNLFALRLPAAILALVLVVFSYKFSVKVFKNRNFALTAALILATSFYIVSAGRDANWDIFTHGFMMVAIYFLYLFFTEKRQLYGHALLAALFFGCSFMSKGPVSLYVLLLPFLISFGIVYKFKNFKSRLTKENSMIDVMLNYEEGLHPYYGLVDIALKYEIIKKVSTRLEFPDGTKAFEKSVYKNPEKYFTEDIMSQLEEAVGKEFKYGSHAEETEVSTDPA